MKNKINIILAVCVLALVLICIASVCAPIRFSHERKERETAVKESLIAIRQAEKKYLEKNGCYCGSFDELVRKGYLDKKTQYIPFSNNKKFELLVSSQIMRSGKQVPLIECGASYSDYLDGLDKNKISELTENADASGIYPGLKFGDITTFNDNAGNWE
jgi:hypothetical protein